MPGELSALFQPPQRGTGTQALLGAVLTDWDPATRQSTVNVGGAVVYANLPMINPDALAVGDVLLASTPAGPIILGNIYSAT